MQINRFEAAGLKCVEVAPAGAAGKALPLVIVLHGRGDWGESYIDLAPAINPTDYRYILPTGPLDLPGALFEWFRFENRNLAPAAGQARRQITRLVDELRRKYAVGAERTVLGGFSQGGIMTLEAGLRYPDRLAGLIELSGALLSDADFNWMNPGDPALYYAADRGDLKQALARAAEQRLPIFLAHGQYDMVVPVQLGRASRDQLQQAGLEVEYYEFKGGHEITLDELGRIRQFLARILS